MWTKISQRPTHFFARYTIDDTILHNANSAVGNATTGAAFPQFGLFASGRNQFLTLAENHIFSPAVLDTTRLSFSRTTVTDRNTYTPNAGDPPLDSPEYQLVAGEPMGIVVLTGISALGGNSGFGPPDDGQIQSVYTLSNDLFYTHGKHALKFGFLVNRYNQGIDGGLRTEGQVTFPSVTAFMTALPSTYIGHTAAPLQNFNRYYVFNTFGMYAQDDYRATSRLTLNLGLAVRIHDNTDGEERPLLRAAKRVDRRSNDPGTANQQLLAEKLQPACRIRLGPIRRRQDVASWRVWHLLRRRQCRRDSGASSSRDFTSDHDLYSHDHFHNASLDVPHIEFLWTGTARPYSRTNTMLSSRIRSSTT